VRVYAKEWLRGAGRFAALCFPYLEAGDGARARARLRAWRDTEDAGRGGVFDGLTTVEDDELEPEHPAFDPELTGVGTRRERVGGRERLDRTRALGEYGDLLRALGADTDPARVAARYYKERALPHLVRFPTRRSKRGTEPLPEGLDVWEPGSPLERVDWVESVVRSPFLVPGVTTVERTYGESPGPEPRREPVDLYVGIDCSGSMPNPRVSVSYPALAGAVVALSALRAGARAKVVLSGEPGETYAMPGFSRDEKVVLDVLTRYLGTGFAFGVKRLADTFDGRSPREPAVHVLLLTDRDVFGLLDDGAGGETGWDVARRALSAARGGGTIVLNMRREWMRDGVTRLEADGWRVDCVSGLEELVDFARKFSLRTYEAEEA
jgi:hypothetical protein